MNKIERLKKEADQEESRATAAFISAILIMVLSIINVYLPDPYHSSLVTYILVDGSFIFLLVGVVLNYRAKTLKEVAWLFEEEVVELKND